MTIQRFKKAEVPLDLHNEIVQITIDPLIDAQIATPFWAVVAHPDWINVNIYMKEVIDRRETGDCDPALYAAKAL